MRPNAVESLRGIQNAIMQNILPELQTLFAQDTAQVSQMLIESLVAEWDAAAHHLHQDNQTMSHILSQARQAVAALTTGNVQAASLVKEIDRVLSAPADSSLTISKLTERNNALKSALEDTLELIEDLADAPGAQTLLPVRRDAYNHLRRVAVRGWSVFDLLSFREKMAQVRSTPEFT